MSKKTMWASAAAVAVVAVVVAGAYVAYEYWNDDDDGSTSQQTTLLNEDLQRPTQQADSATLNTDYADSYAIEDDAFGTTTSVVVDEVAGTRTITSNALPNHDTGDFPNDGNPNEISEQDVTYTYPLTPTPSSGPSEPRQPGVAINGVKFEPGTAETATCNDGGRHRIEAIQDTVDLGLDFNNAHVQPTGAYHYHGISSLMTELYDNGNDLVHVGFAADGYMFYYSKSGQYQSSYVLGGGSRGTGCADDRTGFEFGEEKDGSFTSDWEYVDGRGTLDECNGATIDGQYVYIITEEYPFISRCLKGEFSEAGAGANGPPPSNAPGSNRI